MGRPGSRDRRPPENRPDPIEILHDDDHVIVIVKPTGMITAAERSRTATALDRTRETLRQMKRRDTRVFPVHEIDTDASGVLVFARTPESAEALRRQFRSRKTDRLYEALVEGEIPETDQPAITIRSRLGTNRRGVVESVADADAAPTGEDKPRAAVTHMQRIEAGNGFTLVRLRAETDHPGQLRAHMSEAGHPVAGDRAYNAQRREIPRLALHLTEVSFEHPVTREKLRLRSPSPAGFRKSLGAPGPAHEERGNERTSAAGSSNPMRTAEGESRPTHWDHVSEWYDGLLAGGSDHHEHLLIPGVLRLLDIEPEQTVLDVACGQGVLARALAERGGRVVGIDAAESLIERARDASPDNDHLDFRVGDAQRLAEAVTPPEGGFDSAVCMMALMNIADLDAVCAGAAEMLAPGGRFVGVILHPAFRSPKQTAWGWVGSAPGEQTQFRRVDAYMGESAIPITMNPGAAASGADPVTTTTFHRPIARYAKAIARSGMFIDSIEEWASKRESQPGPRADEENRARQEIPMFMAFRAVKPG